MNQEIAISLLAISKRTRLMIKIFIIEDHPVTIAGLRTYFRSSRDDLVVTLTAKSVKDACCLIPGLMSM